MTPAPDVDLTDGAYYAAGFQEAYRWMRVHQPVFRDRNGLAAAASYQAVLDAERDPELFSNAGGIRPGVPALPHMIDMDDPQHLQRRKLVNAGFTRKHVLQQRSSIAVLVDELIDAVCERGECDVVRDLAGPLPMAVIGTMMGVPAEHHRRLLGWSDDQMNALSSTATDQARQAAIDARMAYTAFTLESIAARRARPTDDLTSVLVHAEVEGARLSDEQIVSETLLLLIGGDETTRHTLSGGLDALLRHRSQWDLLAQRPDLLGSAVEEMLRWTSPVKNMCRTVTAATEFYGTHLRAGEKIMLLFESANFDEAVFDDPDTFDIRRNPNHHLAFGFGTHFCLGNQLARLELQMMTARIVQRLPDLRLATDAPLPLRPANFVSGPESMPVVFTPSAPVRSGI